MVKLKRICLNFTILFFSLLLLSSCGDTDTDNILGTDIQENSFLWKVSSDISTIYLMGSIHVAKPDIYPLEPHIEQAFAESDHLAVEVNILDPTVENRVVELFLKEGLYPRGDNLQNHIPEDLYIRLLQYLENILQETDQTNLIEVFKLYKPWALYWTLQGLDIVRLGYHAENGIDYYFLKKANEANKTIYELESAELQIELLGTLADNLAITLLAYYIDHPPTEEELTQIFDVWKNGDTVKMEEIIASEAEDNLDLALFNERLFDERNINMAEQIESYLKDEDTYFVVVGAGHLVGKNGLISLLVNKGYITKQL